MGETTDGGFVERQKEEARRSGPLFRPNVAVDD